MTRLPDDPDPTTDGTGLQLSRRDALKILGAGAAAPALASEGAKAEPPSLSGDAWSIVSIPDQQHYTENVTGTELQYGKDQTAWIANNLEEQNVAFVTHEGDLVQHGEDVGEWQNSVEIMDTIDGLVPYSVLPGNHDWAADADGDYLSKTTSIQNFRDHYGPESGRFDSYAWFGGFGPDNGANNRNLNSYQLFSAGGYDFLHLALEWEPYGTVDDPDTALGWAQDVLDQHSDRPTIVTTHSHLMDLFEDKGFQKRHPNVQSDRGNSAEYVWENLIAPNPQVFLVLGGHWYRMAGFPDEEWHAGEGDQVSTNDAGQAVIEVLANYQWEDNGGDGWLRQVRFLPGQGGSGGPDQIEFRTYTPSHDQEKIDEKSQFTYDLDFDERFGVTAETVTFQEGVDGYSGTVDTMIDGSNPDTSFATATTVTVDEDYPTHALLRFDGVIGDSDDQVPSGATIQSATLTLESVDRSLSNGEQGVTAYRLLQSWSESATWNDSFGGDGVDTDGTEASSSEEDTPDTGTTGPTPFAVTSSVQHWADGAANHGWAILPNGTDGWDFATSEHGSEPRPELEVVYTEGDGGSGGLNVDTNAATDVTDTSATLNGELTSLGDASEADVWFTYWEKGDQSNTQEWTSRQTRTSTGTFDASVSGLANGTTYVFRAATETPDGTWEPGTKLEFTTQGLRVDTDAETDVDTDSATLNGELISLGGASEADVWFTYWVEGDKSNTQEWTTRETLSETATFQASISGLQSGTTYVFRAAAETPDGTWNPGRELTFTTALPLNVNTDSATNVDTDSATLNGELTSLGGASEADVWFTYWVEGDKSNTQEWTTRETMSSVGSFDASISGLQSGTTYVFRAAAETPDGTWDPGSERTFTTSA